MGSSNLCEVCVRGADEHTRVILTLTFSAVVATRINSGEALMIVNRL